MPLLSRITTSTNPLSKDIDHLFPIIYLHIIFLLKLTLKAENSTEMTETQKNVIISKYPIQFLIYQINFYFKKKLIPINKLKSLKLNKLKSHDDKNVV